ncbi:hypothetical protein N0V83_006231 [Neocucurbitaria cava]|uniref:CENP-V/GFA domain-containing protein n=1 Tax=Neocucurbitaria cava TaxID=798079 RepID=A0A9W8Y6X9_9PLEO|nr:hypothetical protein N0V83_006231 [Neocucurbitaria cava]
MSDASEQPQPSLPTFDPNNCQTYPASCHCGTIQYSVLLSPPLPEWKVVSCNCSICSRNGYLLVYPERSQLHMTSGEDQLKNYTFGKKRNLHKFCGRCGSSVFFDPRMKEYGDSPPAPDLLGVNIRMFHGVNLKELNIMHIEDPSPGKSEDREQSREVEK